MTTHSRDAKLFRATDIRTDDFRYSIFFNPDSGFAGQQGDAPVDFNLSTEEFYNTWILENILQNKDLREASIQRDLDQSNLHFSGYKTAILNFLSSKDFDRKCPSESLLQFLSSIERPLIYRVSKIRQISEGKFRSELLGFLENQKGIFLPFTEVIRSHILRSNSEGKVLREEILLYVSPLHRAGTRHYRRTTDDREHFVSFMHLDKEKDRIYEVGFSYREYRNYLHSATVRINFMLVIVVFTVLAGFRFFFSGALVNPLGELLKGLSKVNEGDLSVEVPVKVEDETGMVYYLNAEHPSSIHYRDNVASFIEETSTIYRKLGTQIAEGSIVIRTFKMKPGDRIIVGSDGKDDLLVDDDSGHKIMNQDETRILRIIERTGGDIKNIFDVLTTESVLQDDLSLLSLTWNGNPAQYSDDYKIVKNDLPGLIDELEKFESGENQNSFVLKLLTLEFVDRNDFEKALYCAKKLIEIRPELTEMIYAVSFCQRKLKLFEQAIESGERVRLRNPFLSKNLLNLAEAYYCIGNLAKARSIAGEVRELEPGNRKIEKYMGV